MSISRLNSSKVTSTWALPFTRPNAAADSTNSLRAAVARMITSRRAPQRPPWLSMNSKIFCEPSTPGVNSRDWRFVTPMRKSRFRTTTRTVDIARDDEKRDLIWDVAVQSRNHVDAQAEDQSDADNEDPPRVEHARGDDLNTGENHKAGDVNENCAHDRVGHDGKKGRKLG